MKTEHRHPRVRQGVEAHLSVGRVGHAELSTDLLAECVVLEHPRGRVQPEVTQILLLLAEDDLPHARVDAIGPDQHVSGDLLSVRQTNGDAVRAVVHLVDRRAEPEIDSIGEALAQRSLEVGTHQAQQSATEGPGDLPVGQGGTSTSAGIAVGHVADRVAQLAQTRQQAHGLRRIEARAEEVDHVPLVARTVSVFHDGDPRSQALQPAGEGETGDAGSADDDSHPSRPPHARGLRRGSAKRAVRRPTITSHPAAQNAGLGQEREPAGHTPVFDNPAVHSSSTITVSPAASPSPTSA